jgi:hypothetical protein
MFRVFANEHWILDRDPDRPLLIVRRTPVSYRSIPVLTKAFDELDAAMDACNRSRYSVLIDLREAIGRNDPDFERATVGHPRRLTRGFIRAAVLVRTANGLLQVKRAAAAGGDRSKAFNNEAEAIAYLVPPAEAAKPPAS